MAANPTIEQRATDQQTRKITAYDLVIGILAIFSLILLIPIYFGNLSPENETILTSLEDALCVIFLFDFFRSLVLATNKWGYFLKQGGWLDLLGSIPISAFAIFRFARLFRIVRLLQKMTGGEFRRMITGRLAQSTLLFTLVVALILVFTIAWIVLQAEQNASGANIKTYHEAVWWAFVTITTVGYGDYYPVTAVGRVIAVIVMFSGIGVFVLFVSTLAQRRFKRAESRFKATTEVQPTLQGDESKRAIKNKIDEIEKLAQEDFDTLIITRAPS